MHFRDKTFLKQNISIAKMYFEITPSTSKHSINNTLTYNSIRLIRIRCFNKILPCCLINPFHNRIGIIVIRQTQHKYNS